MTTVRPGPMEEFNLATNGRVCKETPVSARRPQKEISGENWLKTLDMFKGRDPVTPAKGQASLPGSQVGPRPSALCRLPADSP